MKNKIASPEQIAVGRARLDNLVIPSPVIPPGESDCARNILISRARAHRVKARENLHPESFQAFRRHMSAAEHLAARASKI
jgi:hypothetical protein